MAHGKLFCKCSKWEHSSICMQQLLGGPTTWLWTLGRPQLHHTAHLPKCPRVLFPPSVRSMYSVPAHARESFYRDGPFVADPAMAQGAKQAIKRGVMLRRRCWPGHWQQVGS